MCDIVWIQGVDVSVITGDRVRHVVDNLQLSILVVVTISGLREYQSCIFFQLTASAQLQQHQAVPMPCRVQLKVAE